MYDLVIKGGRVIDPAQNLDDKLDVAVSGGKVAAVAKNIAAKEGKQVFDASNKIVTPGLIDLHCHVYDAMSAIGISPDNAGVNQGVTTVVDGGTTGQAIFGGFPKYVIPSARTTVYCFLHLSSQGLSVIPEFRDWKEVDPEATIAVIEANRKVIKGVKIRMVGNIVASDGMEVARTAKKIASKFNLPIMVHIGDREKKVPATLTKELLPFMEAGDILSHVFTAKWGGILRPDGNVMPELKAAMKRGVVLDIAHGQSNFSFEVARKSMAQGVLPTTLSSDLGINSWNRVVYGMTVTMSKFLALGLKLNQVVEMSTINPARAVRIENSKGSLKPGMDADISVLEIRSGTYELQDAEKEIIKANKLIAPVMTVKAGEIVKANPPGQPQPLN